MSRFSISTIYIVLDKFRQVYFHYIQTGTSPWGKYMYNHFIYIMVEKEITYMYNTL